MALPNTYRQLEYIETDGNSYIDTGYKPDRNTVLEGRFLLGTDGTLFGTSNSSSGSTGWFMCAKTGSYYRFRVVNTDTIDLTAPFNTVSDIYFCGREKAMITQGENVYQTSVSRSNTTVSSYNLYILGRNEAGTVKGCEAGNRVYYVKLYTRVSEGNYTLLNDFIPALRKSDGAVGLYDLLNDNFHANIGSGSFIYPYEVSAQVSPVGAGSVSGTGIYENGSTVSLSTTANNGYQFDKWQLSDYILLDYIESSGTQYIDTGISGSSQMNDIRVSTNMMWTVAPSDNCFLGVRLTSGDTRRFLIDGYGNKWSLGLNSNNFQSDTIITNQRYDVEAQFLSGNSFQNIDGIQKVHKTTALTSTGNHNLTIFAMNRYGTIQNYVSARLYEMQLYEASTDTLIRNFLPVKKVSTNEIGLLDLCEMKFYQNKGTGTFTYGTEIDYVSIDDSPLSFVIRNDVSLIANFIATHYITLVYDSTLGSASFSWIGNSIELVATPNQDVNFKGWYINNVKISSDLLYTYTPVADTTIEAVFYVPYSLTLLDDGNGAISSTRYGDELEYATITCIPNANYHFLKYEVDNGTITEYTNTPLNITLTADTTITGYFEEDDKYIITTKTNFDYGSIYLSDNNVYAGTQVLAWARPFPDYNFVKWEDGTYENPRTITVNSNITLVAEYQRTFQTNGIYQYRCYIKDQLDLTAPPKAFLRVNTFTVKRDLITNSNASIQVLDRASNVNEGDILVLYDPKGTTLYQGVIKSIEDSKITCSQMASFYKGVWIYNVSPQDYLEHEIAVLLQDYANGKIYTSQYVDPLVAQRLGGITIDYVGSTVASLPTDLDDNGNEKYTQKDMEKWIYELYEEYGIIFDFEINMSGANYVHIKTPVYTQIKVGNNMYAISDMSPITTIEETNRLIIFNQDKTYRTTYVATKLGVVEAPVSTANRFDITNTKIVYSDDDDADLIAANLPEQMYNHKLTFTLLIQNFLYDFDDFKLGGELSVWHYDEYYQTVLTGYEIKKESNKNITSVGFTCGKVRVALTKLLTKGNIL